MAGDPIRLALFDVLDDDVSLAALVSDRIYWQTAPQDGTYPLVTFHRQAGTPRWTFAGDPVQDDVFTVKGIAHSAESVDEIAAAIDAALNDAPLSVTGKTVLYLRRQSDLDYAEYDGATVFHHRGAMYRAVTA